MLSPRVSGKPLSLSREANSGAMGWERTWGHVAVGMGEQGWGIPVQEKSVPRPGTGEGVWCTGGVESGSG